MDNVEYSTFYVVKHKKSWRENTAPMLYSMQSLYVFIFIAHLIKQDN